MKKNKKTIILDMDGTLYQFNGGSFRQSGLFDFIRKNSISFIADKLQKQELEAEEIFNLALDKYGSTIGLSVGLELEFGLDRYEYFNNTWDLNAAEFMAGNPQIQPFLKKLQKDFNLVLLSDAPRIWINRVLEYFEIEGEIFGEKIFSGEGDIRKEHGNAFENVLQINEVEAADCISVGDQELTDILPAKKLGMATIFVGQAFCKSADYSVSNILKVEKILKSIKGQNEKRNSVSD